MESLCLLVSYSASESQPQPPGGSCLGHVITNRWSVGEVDLCGCATVGLWSPSLESKEPAIYRCVALSTSGSSCHRKHRCPVEAFCAADIKIRLLICALESRELMFDLPNSLWRVCFGLTHVLLRVCLMMWVNSLTPLTQNSLICKTDASTLSPSHFFET